MTVHDPGGAGGGGGDGGDGGDGGGGGVGGGGDGNGVIFCTTSCESLTFMPVQSPRSPTSYGSAGCDLFAFTSTKLTSLTLLRMNAGRPSPPTPSAYATCEMR